MRPIDIILLIAIAAAVVLAIAVHRRARRSGKGCCADGCSDCANCGQTCHIKKKQ